MKLLAISSVFVAVLVCVSPVFGSLLTVNSQDDPNQDVLITGDILVDELGNKPPFPSDEWIDSTWSETTYRPCPLNVDDPNILNVEVLITNKTGKPWDWLYYVADPETGLTNNDGRVNNCLAFQIDAVGVNTPLVAESLALDGIFQPGETWTFVIQDYTNSLGLAPSLFGSLGVGNCSLGDLVSSGSIIPEPASIALLCGGAIALLRRRRQT